MAEIQRVRLHIHQALLLSIASLRTFFIVFDDFYIIKRIRKVALAVSLPFLINPYGLAVA